MATASAVMSTSSKPRSAAKLVVAGFAVIGAILHEVVAPDNCVEIEPAGPVSEDETDDEETDFPAPTVVEAPPAEAPATVAAVAPSYRDKGKHAHKGKRGKHAYRDKHKHDGDERSKHRGKRGRGKRSTERRAIGAGARHARGVVHGVDPERQLNRRKRPIRHIVYRPRFV